MIAARTLHDLGLEWSAPAVLHLHSGGVCSGAAGELAIRSVFFRRALVRCGDSMDCGVFVLREGRPCERRSRRSLRRRQRRGSRKARSGVEGERTRGVAQPDSARGAGSTVGSTHPLTLGDGGALRAGPAEDPPTLPAPHGTSLLRCGGTPTFEAADCGGRGEAVDPKPVRPPGDGEVWGNPQGQAVDGGVWAEGEAVFRLASCILRYINPRSSLYRFLRATCPDDGIKIYRYINIHGHLEYTEEQRSADLAC